MYNSLEVDLPHCGIGFLRHIRDQEDQLLLLKTVWAHRINAGLHAGTRGKTKEAFP